MGWEHEKTGERVDVQDDPLRREENRKTSGGGLSRDRQIRGKETYLAGAALVLGKEKEKASERVTVETVIGGVSRSGSRFTA